MHEFEKTSGDWVPDVASGVDESLPMGFTGDIRVCIWNSTALFCLDTSLCRRRLTYVTNLASKVDICIIVEAHGEDGSHIVLAERMRNTHAVFHFPGPCQSVGGVVFLIRLTILSVCGQPAFSVLEKGRVVVMKCIDTSQKLVVVAGHIDPHHTTFKKEALLESISRHVCSIQDGLCFVCADSIFEALGERSYNQTRGQFVESVSSERQTHTHKSTTQTQHKNNKLNRFQSCVKRFRR